MMSVCFKEGIKIKASVLDQIISGTQNDLRQTLNHLALWSKGSMEADNSSDGKSENCKKDFKLVRISHLITSLGILYMLPFLGSVGCCSQSIYGRRTEKNVNS